MSGTGVGVGVCVGVGSGVDVGSGVAVGSACAVRAAGTAVAVGTGTLVATGTLVGSAATGAAGVSGSGVGAVVGSTLIAVGAAAIFSAGAVVVGTMSATAVATGDIDPLEEQPATTNSSNEATMPKVIGPRTGFRNKPFNTITYFIQLSALVNAVKNSSNSGCLAKQNRLNPNPLIRQSYIARLGSRGGRPL